MGGRPRPLPPDCLPRLLAARTPVEDLAAVPLIATVADAAGVRNRFDERDAMGYTKNFISCDRCLESMFVGESGS